MESRIGPLEKHSRPSWGESETEGAAGEIAQARRQGFHLPLQAAGEVHLALLQIL